MAFGNASPKARRASAATLVVGGPPRVNLMPPAELERRFRRTLLKRWLLALIGAAVVTLLVIGAATALRLVAEGRLAAERAKTDAFIAEIASLSHVGDTVGTLGDLETYRSEAMVADLGWRALLESLQSTLPDGVTVIGFDVTTGGGAQSDDPAAAPGAVVSLTLAGSAPFDIVPAIRGIRQVPGVLDADGSELRADESKERYVSELSVTTTQEVYSGRFVDAEEADTDEEDAG